MTTAEEILREIYRGEMILLDIQRRYEEAVLRPLFERCYELIVSSQDTPASASQHSSPPSPDE